MIHSKSFCSISLSGLLAWAVLTFLGGCGQSEPGKGSSGTNSTEAAQKSNAISDQPALRIYWAGRQKLEADPQATNLVTLLGLPETAKLQEQTVDKLAAAPWTIWLTNTAVSNAPVAPLREMWQDVVQFESCFDLRAGENASVDFLLVTRLPVERFGVWQTNLAFVLETNSGTKATLTATNLQWAASDRSFALSRFGDWTVFRYSTASSNEPPVPSSIAESIAKHGHPTPPPGSNHFFKADFDLAKLKSLFAGRSLSNADLPTVSVAMTLEAGMVRSSGELNFTKPLPAKLGSWNIPTNIIFDPLISFTAIRGVAPWLTALADWPEAKLGAAPDQIFLWAQSPALWQHFLTYPVADGSNHIAAVGNFIRQEWNPIFQTNKVGFFEWATNAYRLIWRGVPYFQPMVETKRFQDQDFAVFGLFANNATNRPAPAELFAQFQNDPSLLYYDWEVSPPQVTSWTQMGQLMRMVFGRYQLSPAKASLPWLRAITPSLGNSTTVATLAGPTRITFKRNSTCGFTAVELHWLTEWLESPKFPVGLHSVLRPRPPMSLPVSTNSVPQ